MSDDVSLHFNVYHLAYERRSQACWSINSVNENAVFLRRETSDLIAFISQEMTF